MQILREMIPIAGPLRLAINSHELKDHYSSEYMKIIYILKVLTYNFLLIHKHHQFLLYSYQRIALH